MFLNVNPYIFIVAVCLVLGFFSGVVMHRADYCIAGMFRDLFLFRRTQMLRTLLLLIISSMVLFELARQTGMLPLYPFPLLYSPSPANVIGGFIFGLGMVLAGGCVVGTLYKMGAGSILSFTAFLGLIAGSALYAETHTAWAAFIKATTFFSGKITVSQMLGVDPLIPVSVTAGAGLLLVLKWHRDGAMVRPSHARGYLQPWRAAFFLSVIGLFSYLLVGMPMGITSSYAKLAGYIEGVFFERHLEGLDYFRAVPLKYIHPVTNSFLQGGGGPRLDAIAAIQFPLVAGIILGSASSALALGEFRVFYRLPWRQYVSALAGGVIMGMASRMAPTCNIWHLLGGLPILAVSSMLFLVGLLPGAWLGSKILVKAVMKG